MGTAVLMVRFYQGMLKAGKTPAAAFAHRADLVDEREALAVAILLGRVHTAR
jgi:hypothetical protein